MVRPRRARASRAKARRNRRQQHHCFARTGIQTLTAVVTALPSIALEELWLGIDKESLRRTEMRSSRPGAPAAAGGGGEREGGADGAEKTDIEDSLLSAGVAGQQLRGEGEDEQDEENYEAETARKVCV